MNKGSGLLANFFDPKNAPKKPTLPANVIEAVKKYSLKQHQTDLSSWLKEASDKNQVDADGNTLAHLAALAGHVTVFTYVVDKGVNPGVLNKKGSNTLIALIEELPKVTHLPKMRAGYLACIEKCFDFGVDTMCTDGLADKPAMACAVVTGDLELVKLLVKKGVSVNQNGLLGYPLTLAKKCVAVVNHELVHYLEQQGAIENPTNGL